MHDRAESRDDVVFGACALLLVLAAILYLAFAQRPIIFDEVGLYNPVYVYLHTGRMTYPVHGHFDDMTVHPPTHYLVIAWFMRLGFSLFHAAAVLPCAMFLALCLLLLRSTYPLSLKISIAVGVFLGALVWNETYTIRPDLEMALAWITGLIAMECSRQANWDLKRLFLGGLLLAYASAVHYPGFLAATSVLFYVVWMWRTLPRGAALRATASALGGAAVVGVPYVFLFVLPFRQEITTMVTGTQAPGGWLEALEVHKQAYRFWRQTEPRLWPGEPLTQSLLLPLWVSLAPAGFVGPLLLAISRRTRTLAVACLPLVLFIALGARHKMIQYTGYFSPEIVIYLIGLFAAASTLISWAASRMDRNLARRAGWALALVFCAAALHERPTEYDRVRPLKFRWDLDDLDLARAAARDIVHPGAFVAAASAGVWYTAGADRFYITSADIQNRTSISGLDLKSYFVHFNAIAMGPNQSWFTSSQERVTVTSEYAAGNLKLKGFYFGDRDRTTESELSLVLLTAHNTDPVKGYASDGQKLYQFREAVGGDWIYYSAVCPSNALGDATRFPFFLTLFLPGPNSGERDPNSLIRTLLVSRKQFDADVLPSSKGCTVRDQVPGNVAEVSRRELLNQLRNDAPISFYRSLPAALATAGNVRPETMDSTPVDPAQWKGAGSENQLSVRDGIVQFQTTARQWENAAYLQGDFDPSPDERYLFVEADVRKGRVGISLQKSSGAFVLDDELFWGEHDGVTAISIPMTLPGADQVVIRNVARGDVGEVVIKRVAVLKAPHVTIKP